MLTKLLDDGCLAPPEGDETDSSAENTPVNLVKRIPKRIVQNAAGIAIFTCMRSGLWMTGSGGSGILIARKADGTWSPPSALLLHTPTLSFIMGIDVYDCVLVINNLSALESIVQPQVTLGEDVGLTTGPMVPHGSGEEHIRWKDMGNTVLTYLKARGQIQPVNLNGCMLTERANENERFYGAGTTMMDILAGNVVKHVEETRPLFEVIKQAEGRTDSDWSVIDQISTECAPGDAVIESPDSPRPTPPVSPTRSAFGVPDSEDPDPFGVLALEMAGLEIREAGTHLRPTSSQFEFAPSPTSPVFPRFKRQSVDTVATRSNRNSCLSVQTHATDAGTQTSTTSNTPHTTPSLSQSEDGRDRQSLEKARALEDVAEEEVDYTKIDFSPIAQLNGMSLDGATVVDSPAGTDDGRNTERDGSEDEARRSSAPTSPEGTPVLKGEVEREEAEEVKVDEVKTEDVEKDEEKTEKKPEKAKTRQAKREEVQADENTYDDADDEDDGDEALVVFEVASAVQPVRTAAAVRPQAVQAKGAIVNIPKRVPPPLPLRNPARGSRARSEMGDVSGLCTPARASFLSEVGGRSTRSSFASRRSGGSVKSGGSVRSGGREASVGEEELETPVAGPERMAGSGEGPVERRPESALGGGLSEKGAPEAVPESPPVLADDASAKATPEAVPENPLTPADDAPVPASPETAGETTPAVEKPAAELAVRPTSDGITA